MTAAVVDHPVVQDRLTVLRDARTGHAQFRRALHELSRFVIYEALRDLEVTPTRVQTPLAETGGVTIAEPPLLVPVLRAGLGMLDAALELVPDALVGFVGLRRDEQTLVPERYLDTVPSDLEGASVLLLDPMLATGGSLVHACRYLREANAGPIRAACVVAAPAGVSAVEAEPGVALTTAAIDPQLDDRAFIVPGLGDAGDRQYGTA